MAKRSASFLLNVIADKISRKEDISDDLWEELSSACATFNNFYDAYYYAIDVSEKWGAVFLRKMKVTADHKNVSHLISLFKALPPDSEDGSSTAGELFGVAEGKNTIYTWERVLGTLPKDNPLFPQAKQKRDELKAAKSKK